ncbi:MAG: ribosome maturation factor RimP [Panacagrimonas sp.]
MLQDRLKSLIEPLVESLGYELVLLDFSPQSRSTALRLFIDAPDGVVLGDCEKVSREVAALLDVEDPIHDRYQLEVSSPGLDRPLTRREHFDRFAGQRARIELSVPQAGQKRFLGSIKGSTDQSVLLETEQGEKELAFTAIERARLIPDYRGLGSGRPHIVEPDEAAMPARRRQR